MTVSYVNISVSDISASDLAVLLAQLPDNILVGTTQGGWTCLTSQGLEQQEQEMIDTYGKALAQDGRRVVSVLNRDDAAISVDVYDDGAQVMAFNSRPSYFMENPTAEYNVPRLEGPKALMRLWPGLTIEEIKTIFALNVSTLPPGTKLHRQIAKGLGLPLEGVGIGYAALRQREANGGWRATGLGPRGSVAA